MSEVGFELVNEQGEVCACAELAWEPMKVAVLVRFQRKFEGAFKSAGWTVFFGDELTSKSEEILGKLRGFDLANASPA